MSNMQNHPETELEQQHAAEQDEQVIWAIAEEILNDFRAAFEELAK